MVRFLAGSLLVLWALSSTPSHATTVVQVDVATQALDSDAVIEAVVGASTVVRGERMPYTDTELTVTKVLGGKAPDAMVVRQAGGELDGKVTHLPGDVKLQTGERIVGFVRQVQGQWYFTTLAQSVWHVDGDGPKAPVHRDDAGNMMQRDSSGAVVPAMQSPIEYASYTELVTALEGLEFGGGR